MVDMSTIGQGLLDAGLTIVGLAFPEALPVVAIIKELVPAMIAAEPYIVEAVQKGESAFEAANSASPTLGGKLKALAEKIPMPSGVNWSTHLDNVTKAATPGFAVPGWTDQETKAWIDNATPEDSRFGG